MSAAAFEDALFGGKSVEWCTAHWTLDCYAAFGAPVDPRVVLGGWDANPTRGAASPAAAMGSTAMIVTYPVVNTANQTESSRLAAAAAWEAAFVSDLFCLPS